MNTLRSNPFGYNPAADGFVAKVWECMRRNPDFAADVEKMKRRAAPARRLSRECPEYARPGHPCSEFIGTCLVQGGFRASANGRLQRFGYADHWPDLPQGFRARLSALVSTPPLRELRFLSDEPGGEEFGFSDLLPFYDENMDGDEIWEQFCEFLALENKVILVPRVVRDSSHRKSLIRAFEKLLPKIQPKSGRKYDNGGSVLGSAVEWDAYLVYQYFSTLDSLLNAKRMASWFCFDHANFMEWPESDRLSSIGIAQAKAIHEKQSTHTTHRIKAIEKAILAVYPAFSPAR